MDIEGKAVVVTGGGNGLGAALCRRFVALGAAGVVVADRDGDAADKVAAEVSGTATRADVGNEDDIRRLMQHAREAYGRIDILISNAGIAGGADPFTPDEFFRALWQVHVMSGVYSARAVLPEMLERGSGHLGFTASSAGLTTSTNDLAYAATKHAQVAVAEWLAMAYGSRGIGVTCFCPRWMWTEMTRRAVPDPQRSSPAMAFAQAGAVTADDAAERFVDAIVADRFLALTYHDALDDFRLKAQDFEAWITKLRGWHDVFQPEVGRAGPDPA